MNDPKVLFYYQITLTGLYSEIWGTASESVSEVKSADLQKVLTDETNER